MNLTCEVRSESDFWVFLSPVSLLQPCLLFLLFALFLLFSFVWGKKYDDSSRVSTSDVLKLLFQILVFCKNRMGSCMGSRALLALRINFTPHLYSYVRFRPFSEWDGQVTFLRCTDRYTIWTSGSLLTGMNRIYLRDVQYRIQNGRSGFVRTHPSSNVVAISIKYTFIISIGWIGLM